MASLLWAYWLKLINMHTLSPFVPLFTLKSPHWNLQCFSVLRLLAGISQLAVSVFYLGWKWDWMLQKLVNGTSGDIWCPAEWISWPPHPHHWEVFFLLALKLAVYIAHFRASNISVFVKHLPQGSTASHCAPTKYNTARLSKCFFHLKELFPAWGEKSALTQISDSQCDKGKWFSCLLLFFGLWFRSSSLFRWHSQS